MSSEKALDLALDSSTVTEDQTDFPVAVKLGKSTGKTGFDSAGVFTTQAGKTAKSVVFDIADCWGYSLVGVRDIEFYYKGYLIPLSVGDFTATATETSGGYAPANPFYSASLTVKTGAHTTGNCWLSNYETGVRLIVTFTTPIVFDEIRINNFHNSGTQTTIGMKNTKILVSPDTEITSTVYDEAISDGELIFDGEIPEHSAVNEIDESSVDLGAPSFKHILN